MTLKNLNIPRMGSVENAKMIEWRVAEGTAFSAGDILYEIETDKTATEVEADERGILVKQLAAEGDEFKVGDRVGLWAEAGTSQIDIAAALAVQTAASEPTPQQPASRQVSPLARRLAAESGVDLNSITGTGPGGRITEQDVRAAAGSGGSTLEEAIRVPHSLRRKTIAQRMAQAAAIPSLTADMEIALTGLFARRKSKDGVSVLGLIAKETISALLDHPRLNAHWQDDAMLQWKSVNLGIAVDTDDGLVVPVIRNVETLDAAGLTAAIAAVAEKARAGTLTSQELEGGTFTISNPGAIGPTIRAEALLNPPQVALLGLPGIVQCPEPVIRPSLTFDHRALDGGPVIRFLNDLKARIEAL